MGLKNSIFQKEDLIKTFKLRKKLPIQPFSEKSVLLLFSQNVCLRSNHAGFTFHIFEYDEITDIWFRMSVITVD